MTKSAENCGKRSVEELVSAARSGDSESLAALAARCVFISRKLAAVAAGLGMDTDDLRQEALIALMRALHSYSPDKGAVFTTYASVCIRRHLSSVIRAGFRQKNLPMVSYLPLEESSLAPDADPESLLIEEEEFYAARDRIFSRLSAFEREMLELYLNGLSYAEISQRTGKSEKSVGNALARTRRKLRSEA